MHVVYDSLHSLQLDDEIHNIRKYFIENNHYLIFPQHTCSILKTS